MSENLRSGTAWMSNCATTNDSNFGSGSVDACIESNHTWGGDRRWAVPAFPHRHAAKQNEDIYTMIRRCVLVLTLFGCVGCANDSATDETQTQPNDASELNTSSVASETSIDMPAEYDPQTSGSSLQQSMSGGMASVPGLAGDEQMLVSNESAPSDAVRIETSMGVFTLALDSQAAPNTVANFLQYVDTGFYDGSDGNGATIFHRVISNFMVQGGGILADGSRKATQPAIRHESPNALLNLRGTVAMARTGDIHSATSQFFVNHRDNAFLDYVSSTEPGYVVFGRVVEGMAVIDNIASVNTDAGDMPLRPILIDSVTRL